MWCVTYMFYKFVIIIADCFIHFMGQLPLWCDITFNDFITSNHLISKLSSKVLLPFFVFFSWILINKYTMYVHIVCVCVRLYAEQNATIYYWKWRIFGACQQQVFVTHTFHAPVTCSLNENTAENFFSLFSLFFSLSLAENTSNFLFTTSRDNSTTQHKNTHSCFFFIICLQIRFQLLFFFIPNGIFMTK